VQYELQLTPQGKQFDFSEVSIFGNFDMFCKRIQKLEDVVQTIEQVTPSLLSAAAIVCDYNQNH